ncbi:MAG: ABC transporter ATP-binding protein [Elusimicrobia bacterium]|nr:ABC transporter ATP-binding protein [Elusimicrobiota bacterium]
MFAIEASGLTKIYRRSHLGRVKQTRGVENLNLQVREGEIFGLLGLNGSGKTTTIKLFLGLLKPTQGQVRIWGSSPQEPSALAQIGYLPELPYLYRYLTPRELLRFFGVLSGIPGEKLEDRISEVLRMVQLLPKAGVRLAEFSKGMLQRVGIAQAVLHGPRLIVLDEPVSGLDPLSLRQMRSWMLELQQAGHTLFFSSHSISEVERVCHRVAILREGRLACVLEQREWQGEPGRLEDLFIEVVRGAEEFAS